MNALLEVECLLAKEFFLEDREHVVQRCSFPLHETKMKQKCLFVSKSFVYIRKNECFYKLLLNYEVFLLLILKL